MSAWLLEVGTHTASHREGRARHLDECAKRKRAQRRLAGANERQVHEDTCWYRSRAKGQREKIDRVQSCGAEHLRITCQSCGRFHERPGRCGNSLLCVRCRGATASAKRRTFLLARAAVLGEAEARGLLERRRSRGRFSEKFLSLTEPHLATDSIASRIHRMQRAWPIFRRELKRYVNAKDARTFEWFRVLEWTSGSDGLGHPHLHLWLFCCFLDREHVKELWRMALIRAGCPAEHCRDVIIDLREFREAGSGAQELIKYLTKDIDANGHKVPPEVYADVYKALDGSRLTQASRGFMALAKRGALQCECGASLPRRVRKLKQEAPPSSTTDGVAQ